MSSQKPTKIVGFAVVIVLISSGGLILGGLLIPNQPGNNTETVTITTTGLIEDFVPIDELVAATFDGTGFGDEPGSSSTISSTLSAIELLSEFNLINSSITQDMLNDTYNAIMEREHPNGGFQEVAGFADQSLEATALSARTLRLMNRLTVDVIISVRTFLIDEFRGGLSYENWISEGVLTQKYWGLRCAHETGAIVYIGLKPITLDNIFEVGEDPGIGTDPVLWTDEIYYGTRLDQETLADRLIILECFEYMIPNPLDRPVLIGLLVNESNTMNELCSMYSEESGLISNSIEFTWTVFRILTNTGNMSHIFSGENSMMRINQIQEQIDAVVDIENARANPNATISEILFLTKIERLIAFNLDHGFIETSLAIFYDPHVLIADITAERKDVNRIHFNLLY